ncbi:hypothetical protein [Ottowia sp.]|uniref:hypothetical protein n=1 Tax=Ottowia sp. TaxID=1898956 RepID=UPI0039E37191
MSGPLTARQLLQRFAVHGRFYERQVDGVGYRLRSHLEIFDRGALAWPAARAAPADLVAVMMNPGGSRPLHEPDADGWAEAVPDRTQYQLMKLALAASAARARPIRHIRVINLSDLRTPKSAELFAALGCIGGWHSLFDDARAAELRQALGPVHTPVLRAWGMSRQLNGLAARANRALAAHAALGLTEDGLAYRHPLPQRADLQRAWLEQATSQLSAAGA